MGRKWLWFLLSALAVLAIFWAWLGHDNSPTYHGRTLSAWIQRLPAASANRGISWGPMVQNPETAQELEAEDAVRHIGTNALPYLLTELHAKDGVREQLLGFWTKVKDFSKQMISRRKPASSLPSPVNNEMSSGELRHWNAARGFHALGPLGKSAIPELMPLLTNGFGSSCPDAAYALSAMGPEGVAAMVPILTNNSPFMGDWAQMCEIWALGQTPSAGRLCVRELMALAQGTNNSLQWSAIWTLGQLKTNDDLIAPAVAAHLGDSGFNVRWACENALQNYGLKDVTRSSLKKCLDDPQLSVRMAATNAMIALYPDEVAKAAAKK